MRLNFKRILCLFGHTYDHRFYSGAFPTRTQWSSTIGLDGEMKFYPPITIGLFHYGLCARCRVCGNINWDPSPSLPILEPKFGDFEDKTI